MKPMGSWKRYRAGVFLVDASDRTVRSGEQTLALSPKELQLFELLADRPGEIVEKEKILSTLWPDAHVSEGNLTQHVYRLRSIFGNDAIQTVPKRGYRLVLPVSEVAEVAEVAAKRGSFWRPAYQWLGIAGMVAAVAMIAAARFRNPAPHAEAYDLFLRAQSHLEANDRQDTPAELREARKMAADLLGQAIERDPAFADAHGLLAQVRCELTVRNLRTDRFLDQAEESARRALALDANNLHAWTARICIAHARGRQEEALQVAVRIRKMNLVSAAGAFAAGEAFLRSGLVDRAADEFRRAVQLSPRTLGYREQLAYALLLAGKPAQCMEVLSPVLKTGEGGLWDAANCLARLKRWDESVIAGERFLANSPGVPVVYRTLGIAYREAGREREARALFERGAKYFEGRFEAEPNGRNAVYLSSFYAHLGKREEAERWVQRALEQNPGHARWMFMAGVTYATLGEDDRALEYLEKAFQAGFSSRPLLDWEIQPNMGPRTLRDRPEFQALRKRMDERLAALEKKFGLTS